MEKTSLTVLVPVRNEEKNLPYCLRSLDWVDKIYVVDSQSTDKSAKIAKEYGARVVQYHYAGGWPKKRQWALENLDFAHQWVLLLDADEIVTPELAEEIKQVIRNDDICGYYIRLRLHFMGRMLRFGGTHLWKLSLFCRGKGRFEHRFLEQDISMGDTEVHEHVIVDGKVGKLRTCIDHRNRNGLARYIAKHNEYSNWEARVLLFGEKKQTSLCGQARQRRWLKTHFIKIPGSPLALFFFSYILKMGFADGVAGLIYCSFQAIQLFCVKAKMRESSMYTNKK